MVDVPSITSIDISSPTEVVKERFGLETSSSDSGCVEWDLFEAAKTPGALILVSTWRSDAAAERFRVSVGGAVGAEAESVGVGAGAESSRVDAVVKRWRVRVVNVIRDYGMLDRREAPQWWPDVVGGQTVRA